MKPSHEIGASVLPTLQSFPLTTPLQIILCFVTFVYIQLAFSTGRVGNVYHISSVISHGAKHRHGPKLSLVFTFSHIGMITFFLMASCQGRPGMYQVLVIPPCGILKMCAWDSGQPWTSGKLYNLFGCLLEVIPQGHCPDISFVSGADSCFSYKS